MAAFTVTSTVNVGNPMQIDFTWQGAVGDVTCDYGDGTNETKRAGDAKTSHTYSKAGNYNGRFTQNGATEVVPVTPGSGPQTGDRHIDTEDTTARTQGDHERWKTFNSVTGEYKEDPGKIKAKSMMGTVPEASDKHVNPVTGRHDVPPEPAIDPSGKEIPNDDAT